MKKKVTDSFDIFLNRCGLHYSLVQQTENDKRKKRSALSTEIEEG